MHDISQLSEGNNMSKDNTSFLTYQNTIPDVVSRFVFDHHAVIDPTGLIVTPQGFARPFYHEPTNTVGLMFSKTAANLFGDKKSDGKLYATSEQAQNCYIVSAYRCETERSAALESRREIKRLSKRLRNDLDNFCEDLNERNQKHFTAYVTDNITTNGSLTYEIIKTRKGYNVVLNLASERRDGGFVPYDIEDKSLSGYFSRLSQTVAKCKTYEEAKVARRKHWDKMAAEYWDQKDVYKGRGKLFMAKKLMADFVNTTTHHASTFVITTAGVSGLMMLYKPEYTVPAAVVGTVVHTAAHITTEKSKESVEHGYKKRREDRHRLDIKKHKHGVDASDHFKVQTKQELTKICPHIDWTRFSAEEFMFPGTDEMSLLRNREQLQSNLKATSLEGHLLFMHQRGFSSECNLIDRRTRLDTFQSGIVRLMHERNDGTIVVYGQYIPEMCTVESQRLPQNYIDMFEGGIVRVEYDPSKSTFSTGLIGSKIVSHKDMIQEVERDFLYYSQTTIPWSIRSQAQDTIRGNFVDVDDANARLSASYKHTPRFVGSVALQPSMV